MTTTRVAIAPVGGVEPRIETVDLPGPGPHQVLVRQQASGICHSQLHQLRRSRTRPMALGHESVGTVVATGDGVTSVDAGDRALVTWLPHGCAGRTPKASSVSLASGAVAETADVFTWADHSIVDEAYTVRIPPEVTADVTSVLGCAVMTGAGAVCRTAAVAAGESVAVIGVGGVGACAVAAARIVGADPIVAVDVDDAKLDLAGRLGATHRVNSARSGTADLHARFDHVVDCVGSPATVSLAMDAVRRGVPGESSGGTAVLVGVPTENVELDARQLQLGETSLVGSFGGSSRPAEDLPRYLRWYQEGLLDLDALVTRRYRLDDIATATADLAAGRVLGRAIVVP